MVYWCLKICHLRVLTFRDNVVLFQSLKLYMRTSAVMILVANQLLRMYMHIVERNSHKQNVFRRVQIYSHVVTCDLHFHFLSDNWLTPFNPFVPSVPFLGPRQTV